MSSSARKPSRSVSSQSSHHSSIEPRGAPEFNREYARQLSLAKRSRSASRTHGRAVETSSAMSSAGASPMSLSPPPSTVGVVAASRFNPLGSLFASAKEMVATTPTRVAKQPVPAEDTPRIPMVQKPPLAPPTPSASPRSGANEAKPTVPQSIGKLPSVAAPANAMQDDSQGTNDVVSVARMAEVVLVVWVAMFVLFCGIALFTSEDAAYRPHYFSLRRAPTDLPNATFLTSKPHGVDRVVPQVCRQLALRVRQCGRLASSAFMSGGQLQVLGMVMSDIGDGVWIALLGVYDRIVAPLLDFIMCYGGHLWTAVKTPVSALTRGGANESHLSVSTLFQPLVQATNFMVIDPTRSVYDTTISFFVSTADALRYVYYSFLSDLPGFSHRNATKSHTSFSASQTSTTPSSRAAPLKSLGSRLWSRGKHTTLAAIARGMNVTSSWLSSTALPADESLAVPITFRFSSHYQHRLDGDLWKDILAVDEVHVKDLVTREVTAALKNTSRATVTRVCLRPGSLIIDVDVTQEVTATPGRSGKHRGSLSKKEQQAIQRKAHDKASAALQKWPFSSVKRFYETRAQAIRTRQDQARREAEQAHTQAQRAAEAAAEHANKPADDCACLRHATAATVKRCKLPAKQLSGICGDVVAEATAGEKNACAEKLAVQTARVETETDRTRAQRQQALAAANKTCTDKLRFAKTASDEAHKKSAAALRECQTTAKEQQEACQHQIEKMQREAAAATVRGEKSAAATAAAASTAAAEAELKKVRTACEARVATEVAQCHAEHEAAQKTHDADQAAALEAAKQEFKSLKAKEVAAAVAQCQSAAATAQRDALMEAEQICQEKLTAQTAPGAAKQSANAECARVGQQLEHVKAEAAQCAKEKATAETRLATEAATWATEKAALTATMRKHEADLRAELEASVTATRQLAGKACDARIESMLAAAEQERHAEQDRTCAEQRRSLEASLRASCTAATEEAVRKEHDRSVAHVAQQLAAQRTALSSESERHSRLRYVELCEAACRGVKHARDAALCVAHAQQLRRTMSASSNTAPLPSVWQLLNHSSGIRASGEPACALAWIGTEELSAAHPKQPGLSWRTIASVTLLVGGSGAVAFISARVALRQHRTAVFLREEVRKLQKEVASLEREHARQHASSSSTSRDESPTRPAPRAVSGTTTPPSTHTEASQTRPTRSPELALTFTAMLNDHFECMTAWHFTCCNLIWMSASGTLAPAQPVPATQGDMARGAFGDDALTSPPQWRDWSSSAAATGAVRTVAQADASHPPTPRDHTAPSTPTEGHITIPATAAAAVTPPAHLERRVVRAYYYMLESYYVDLLESVTNRELIENQLEEMEEVASKQMNLLQTQSSAVDRLQEEVRSSASELAAARKQHQTECAAYQQQIAKQKAAPLKEMEALRAELEKAQQETRQATQMRNLQSEMVAVLEEQLNRVTTALEASQGTGAAAPSTAGPQTSTAQSDLVLRPTTSATTRQQGSTSPRMTRGESDRREYRELDWRDQSDPDQ